MFGVSTSFTAKKIEEVGVAATKVIQAFPAAIAIRIGLGSKLCTGNVQRRWLVMLEEYGPGAGPLFLRNH